MSHSHAIAHYFRYTDNLNAVTTLAITTFQLDFSGCTWLGFGGTYFNVVFVSSGGGCNATPKIPAKFDALLMENCRKCIEVVQKKCQKNAINTYPDELTTEKKSSKSSSAAVGNVNPLYMLDGRNR